MAARISCHRPAVPAGVFDQLNAVKDFVECPGVKHEVAV
jgi:hypothetical protein